MRCKGKLQHPLTISIITLVLFSLLLCNTAAFTFSSAQISVSDLHVNAVASYTFSLARSYDDVLNPTDWNSSFVPSSATATIIFPSQFSASQLSGFSCSSVMVNLNSVASASCALSGTTITISSLFSGSDFVSEVDVILDNIINPPSAVTTSAFIGTIGTDISNDSPIADVTYSANALNAASISFIGGVVNRTSDMIVSLTTADPVPSNGIVTILFPATNLWARELSSSNLIPINGALSCYGLTPEISNTTIQCQGQYSSHIVTISTLFSAAIPSNGVISIGIKGLFAPPTTEQADTLTVSTCDNLGNAINTKTSLISGLTAQTLTPFSLQSSLTTAMGVNNFAGGLTFTFTLTDTISIKNSFVITFPLGTTITYIQRSCSINLQSVTYNSSALTLTMVQNSSNPNYNAGTSITFTFIRFRAPPSTKATLPIVFSIVNNGYSSMTGSGSISAVANNYSLSVSANSIVINEYTKYNFTFTMNDPLSNTGYFVILLDPQLCASTAQKATITTNLSITIAGTSINASPSTQISTTTVNGSSTYQLLLSNLNTSSSNIPSQTVTINVNNILNPGAVTTINSFALSTYYSNSADLVANANYSSSFKLQTGALSLLTVTSTATTSYTFTTLTLNIKNTNPIPVNGFILLAIPSDITLLSASQSSVSISGSMVSSTYTNSLSNNTVTFKIGSSIDASSTISLIITDIMTQSSTKTTATFAVSTFDASLNGIDQSSNSLGLSITSGNNFNSLSLAIVDPTNSKDTNYSITFEQIQSYSAITTVSLTFNSFLSTSSLSRVFEVTSSGTVFTPCIFSKVNSSYALITLSQNATSSHTILLQTIGNPPSQAPLASPILVRTLTSDSAYIYSQMYTDDIINTAPSKLTINSYSFSSYVFSSPTNLSLSITSLTAYPTLTYKLIIDIPAAIDASSASCTSNTTNLQCSLFAPTNALTISMSDSSSLPLNIIFSINYLTAPVFGSSPQTFILSTFDSNNYLIQLDDSTVIFNNNCSLTCRTCSSSNSSACLTCYSSSNLTLLYSQTCLNACPSTTYQANTSCVDCSSSCLTCSNSSTNCSSCNSTGSTPYYYSNVNSSTGLCLSACSVGTYALNLTCNDCPSICTSCSSSSYCYQCQSGYLFYNGTCLLACPNNTLTNSTNSSCQDCQSPCSSCANTTATCLTCIAGNVLFNSTCTSTCPSSNLYVSSNQTCELCDSLCSTCFGIASNCTSCNLSSNFTHLFNFSCVNSCPDLYYSNTTTAFCLPCSSLGIGCANCSSATTCLSCDSGFLFFPSNNTCLNFTPSGYFSINGTLFSCNSTCNTCNGSSTNCTSCSGNSSLYQNQCISSCPANLTVSVSNICQNCSFPCATCFNSTSKCLSCAANSSLYYDSSTFSCINATSCPNSTFSDNSTFTCATCNSSCILCSGNSTNCSSCSADYYLIAANNTCSSTCPDGTVKSNTTGNVCQLCQYPCSTCLNTANYCLSCSQANSTLFLSTNGTCVSNSSCQASTYANTSNYQCQSCVSPCSTCQSATICNTCLTNYSLIASNNTCSTSCPTGEAPSLVNGSSVCTACAFPCSTCENTITNCSSCSSNSSLYLQGNQCVNASSCSVGTYANSSNNSCSSCPSSCTNCSSLLNCSDCSIGYFLDSTLCVTSSACQNGTVAGYNSTSGRNECIACTSPCTTCTINTTTCSSCSQANSSLFLLNNSCVNATVCPSGTFADQITFTCLACVAPCLKCSNYSICISCVQDYFLNGTQCLGLCPNGTYVFNQSGIISCVACNSTCATCTHEGTNCTSCPTGSYLFNYTCMNATACPSGTFPNTNSSQCTNCSSPCLSCSDLSTCLICSSNLSILNGTCYSSCPNGTVSLTANGSNSCVSCSLECSTCTSSINTCTSCSNSSTYLYNGSCYDPSTCPNGTFANSDNSSCTVCNSTCQLCSNTSYCQSCAVNYYLLNATCTSICPNGTLATNSSGSGLCSTCQYPCASCSNSLTNCTSCANSSSFFYFNNSCYNSSSCPQGTYQNNLTLSCDTCISPCATCLSSTVCQTCTTGLYLNPNSSCLTTCVSGTIPQNSTLGGVCDACTYPCTTCSNSLTNCTACSQTNGTLFFANGSCVANTSCSNGTYANTTTLKCEACSSVCSSCSTSLSCLACATGFYLDGTSCISSCPNGTVKQNTTSGGICEICTYPCSTCSESTTNCSTCSQTNGTMYYSNNSCITNTSCPNGTYPNNTSLKCQSCVPTCSSCSGYSVCQSCSAGFYFSNNTCISSSSCPNGTLAQNGTSGGVCLSCSYPCTLCSASLSNCTSCSQANSTLFLANGSCVSSSSCSNGTYANITTLKCESCSSACSLCSSLIACSACNAGFFLNGTSCVSTCPNGKVGDNSSNTCVNCQPPCNYCSMSQSNCTSCVSPYLYYSLNNSCLTSCPDGYYSNSSLLICQSCVSPCSFCSSSSACTSCVSGFYFYSNSCLSTCPSGYYNNNSSSTLTCSLCTNNCSTCSGVTTCTSCSSPYLLYNGVCGTSCPITAIYNVSNTCLNCYDAVSGCLACNTSINTPVCLLCNSSFVLSNGKCVSLQSQKDALSNSLTSATIFPLPFTITGSIIFIACFMSKLQNKNSYVVGTAYSLFGFIESACLIYTIISYHLFIASNSPSIDYQIYLQAAMFIIIALNLFGLLVQTYQLHIDEKFGKWTRSKCNYCCYIVVAVLSCLINYKFKMLIFTKLFSFYCLRAQLESVQKFRVFNVMSFLGVGHEGLVIYISAIIMATLPTSQQMFLSFLDLVIVNVINIGLALAVSSKEDTFFEQEEDDGVKINKVFNLYDDSYEANPVDSLDEKKGKGKFKEKEGLQSRDMMMDDDDQFTLSISDRDESNRSQAGKIVPEVNSSAIMKKNKSMIVDSQASHDNEHQPSQTGNSLKKNGKAAAINNFSAVYEGDLSRAKRKKFQQSHRISKEIAQKSKQSASEKANEQEKNVAQQQNIFDMRDAIEEQAEHHEAQNNVDIVPVSQINKENEANQHEDHQFDQFQTGVDNTIQVFVKGQPPKEGAQAPESEGINKLNPSASGVSIIPSVREIKVYKGKQPQGQQPEDIEEIDLTISKKQRELIELRKSIRKKERERERSQDRKSRKRSNSKEKRSREAMSEVGLFVPQKSRDIMSSRGSHEQAPSTHLQVIEKYMESSKLIEEQLVAPATQSPKKQNTGQGPIQEEISQPNTKGKVGKLGNTIEQQMIESTIMVDETKEINFDQVEPEKAQDIFFEPEPTNRSSPSNTLLPKDQTINTNNQQTNQTRNHDTLANNPSNPSLHSNQTPHSQAIKVQNVLFLPSTQGNPPPAGEPKKMKVQFQQMDRQYDNKYYISPREEINYDIQEMNYDFVDPDSVQNRRQQRQPNIFQPRKEETSFISEQPSQAQKRKLVGFISKPQPHKKINPDSESDSQRNDNDFNFKMAPDTENNPLQNKLKHIAKQGAFGSNKSYNNQDALDEMVDRTSRIQVSKNRSHLIRKSEEREERENSTGKRVSNQEMRAIPTQESRLYQQINEGSTVREASDKEITERKMPMNRPPLQHQRPATTEKHGRTHLTGLKHLGNDQYQRRPEMQKNDPLAARTSYDMSFKEFKSNEFEREGDSNRFDMYPSSFSSNRIQLDSDELARQPNKPSIKRTNRLGQEREMKEEESSLHDSFARKSMKSYKSRSVDREDYQLNQQQATLNNSRKKSINRGQDNQDLNDYYKRSKDSPSNRSNKSRSRSKSREGNRSSDRRSRQLQKIYLQRLQFKK